MDDGLSQAQGPEQATQPDWVWSKDQIWAQYGIWPIPGVAFERQTNLTASSLAMVLTWFCSRWVVYSWPKVAFWTQEVLRRTEALPNALTAETQHDLNKFVRKAAYLMCVFDFDPQNGTEWSVPVADFMRQVRAAPSTSLEMPDLSGWFAEPPQSASLFTVDACMFWVTSNLCDLGFLARRLKGNKDLGDSVCWDKVPKREYNVPFMNMSLDLGFNLIPTDADFEHDEYLTCQEHRLTQEELDASCPMFGHYPEGMWGLPDWLFSFGEAPEEGSETYNGVLQCNAKIGVPENAHLDYSNLFPYADNMDLMEWNAQATKMLFDEVFGLD